MLFRSAYGGMNPRPNVKVNEIILKPPEQYMKQIWICANLACEGRSLPNLVDRFGADRFLINSDYPHGLGGPGERAVELVRSIGNLNREQQDRILGSNASELFGIDPETRQQRRGA